MRMDISSINSDLIRGNVTTIILKSLSMEDRYGYDILREIEVKSEGHYKIKQPTLYSCLKRLEKQGLISSYWGSQSDTEGGRRRYYSLTDSGRDYVEQMQSEYEYSRTILDKLLSEEKFDLDSSPAPFDINSLRPYTKRQSSTESDNDNKEEEVEKKENIVTESASKTVMKNEPEKPIVENIENNDADKIADCNDNKDLCVKENDSKTVYDIKGSSYDDTYRSTARSVFELVDHIDKIIDKKEETEKQEIQEIKETKETLDTNTFSESNVDYNQQNDIDNLNTENLSDITYETPRREYYRPKKLSISEDYSPEPSRTIVVSEEKKLQREEACRALGIGKYTNEAPIDLEEWENAQKKSEFTENEDKKDINNATFFNKISTTPANSKNNETNNVENNFVDNDKNTTKKPVNVAEKIVKSENPEVSGKDLTINEENILPASSYSFRKDTENVCNYLDAFSDLRKTTDFCSKETENTETAFVQRPASNIDLKTKLYSAGYKVRPYSRENTENYYSLNFLHSNKLNRDCYAIMYVLLLIELVIGRLIFKDKYQGIAYIAIGIIGILIPAIPFVIYSVRPDKRIRANFNFKTSILNRLMLFLNLIVIVCLIGFFGFGANINDAQSMLAPILIPIILLLNIPLSSVVYLILYNSKKYHVS